MTRRSFGWIAAAIPARLAAKPEIRRETFLRAPRKGVAVMGFSFYTRRTGGEMVSVEQRWSRSDTIDVAYLRHSSDSGKTWSAPEKRATGEKTAHGMLRRHLRAGFVDPHTGRYLEFWNEGVLPNDNPLEGMRRWNIFYRLEGKVHQLIQSGTEFSATHPLPGIYTGKNCVMFGDTSSVPLALKNGTILLPVDTTALNPDGSLYNPTGGYTYTDAVVLIGKWRQGALEWQMAQPVKGDPRRSTRGMDEPTLAELAGGRVMMVMRGSNDKSPALPGYRWVSFSGDAGRTWTVPKPWTYSNGESFYSPSSCSQLLAHPNGKLYWLGNISRENPRGNRPRYPFYIGEVDQESGLLIRDRLRMVDDRQPGESDLLTLSNFYAREDRQTGGVALHMTRLFAFPDGWVGDASMYRIEL
jgi:BNR repeat-like domain